MPMRSQMADGMPNPCQRALWELSPTTGDFEQSHVIEQGHALTVGDGSVMPVDSIDIHSAGAKWNPEGPVLSYFLERPLVDVRDEVSIGVHVQHDALHVVHS